MISHVALRPALIDGQAGRTGLLASAVMVILVAGLMPVAAQQSADADWPCAQRRAGTISAGTVWQEGDPAEAGPWDKDFEAAALAQKLASRRTPVEDVDGLLDDFVSHAGADRKQRLTRVFAGVLELVNTERDRVLLGISRYARGQNRLAERVRADSEKLGDVLATAATETDQTRQDAETSLRWDKRIFEERSRSLTYVCETPVLLERRLFDVARRIQQRL